MQTDPRYRTYRERLAQFGQEHLLTFWDELDEPQRRELLEDIDRIDLPRCARLADELVRVAPHAELPADIRPAPILPADPGPGEQELYRRAQRTGEEAVRAGRVAAFTVAGGQGTRLGFDGPKGAFPISPIRGASLFQLFAEYLHGVGRRWGHVPRWYIMTSPGNHAATVEFFAQHAYFGLDPQRVFFFAQGQMPVFLPDGRIALCDRHRVAMAPDGHGGSLRALRASGALDEMARWGIDYISYFQVDNPLVRPIDPRFLGLHILHDSEMSSKAVHKLDDLERVGNFCLADGRLMVIEYSDLPEHLAHQRRSDGSRVFDAGSIAVHILSRTFVERLGDSTGQLPWHRASKSAPVLADDGPPTDPGGWSPRPTRVIKLEQFVFDAIPLARHPLVVYTHRQEEFSPIKNAEGTDCPATARRDLIRRAARWLTVCGHPVPRDSHGEPAIRIEISPSFALDADDLAQRLAGAPAPDLNSDLLLA